ncbi:MAG: VOC family protein [Chloroflexota bacterium]|nr:VOC family protein [Chloroflexota bacterium]
MDDVGRAIEFYTGTLDFVMGERFGDAMAIIRRGDLTLWLAGPAASASRPMPDGRVPRAGGWNRIVVEVDDLAAEVSRLRDAGAQFRNDIVSGPGGGQILMEDPAGNPVELFQARG